MMDWNLADAKNKFSEVVRRALAEGPQRVLRRKDAVVVLSEKDYQRLAGTRVSFKDFLLNAPDMDGLDLERDTSPMRDVSL
ncbi:MAG: type II toxin-antitoxin system Phd/YefM family antitoxin [Planctomycetes bacterium]|nr:type II toxin-antitoxin system Phd/YefM family antitoxin [Planctomycetota bacterium]